MEELIRNITNGVEVRTNLIQLKEMLKEASVTDAFLQLIDWNMDFFRTLLHHEDAKVRKNIIQIIGICELDGLADDLFAAYEEEKTLFVRPEYVKVLQKFDMQPYLGMLEKRQKQLMMQQESVADSKHVSAELRALNTLLKQYGRVKAHQFIGKDTQSVMVLTTVSGKEQYLQKAIDRTIGEGKTTPLKGGVKVVTSDYENLMKVRCFQEVLFVLPKTRSLTVETAARQMVEAGLVSYLQERISGSSAYPFRLDIRGNLKPEEKARRIRQISKDLERETKHQLVNAPSDYEIEIRLLKKKSQQEEYAMYLRIPLLKDERFAYRRHTLPTSIQPYVAALMMEIARPYITGRGQVLDPFCGTGTMLMERNYAEHAHSLYGVDIYGEAVRMANEHASLTHMPIHYMQKDMADFTHAYRFDLLVTNLPAVSEHLSEERMLQLYQTFLYKCHEWMEKDGILLVYTQSPDIFAQALQKESAIRMIKQIPMYKKGRSTMYILQMQHVL